MSNIFLFGSLAYDCIIDYDGVFDDLVDANSQRAYNFSFLAKNITKEFGGCAGNIAYNLKLLGKTSFIISSLGSDSLEYLQRLKELNLETKYIRCYTDLLTAQAHIIADKKNNQITSFFQGSLSKKYDLDNLEISENDLAIVSPDSVENMKSYIKFLIKKGIKFIFDPGQVVGLFSKSELMEYISKAYFAIANDYEFDIINDKVQSIEFINHSNFIVTKGELGLELNFNNKKEHISAFKLIEVKDSTGCGDSFRAGLIFGIQNNINLIESCKIGSALASYNIECYGTQNHQCSLEDIMKRAKEIV